MKFVVIIPARFASTRLPGKPLALIHGKPMVVHVLERAKESGAERVIVATDHLDVFKAVELAGGEACMTRSDHQSGTERLTEVIERYHFSDDEIIVNVQGDEPLIQPELVSQVAGDLASCSAKMATIATPIKSIQEAFDPNTVRVVLDAEGNALYFSRAAIPWDRDGFSQSENVLRHVMLRHVGLYAYRAGFLRRYSTWKQTQLEKIESLEQLRVLWYGEKIHVLIADSVSSIGIDTAQDLERVRQMIHPEESLGYIFMSEGENPTEATIIGFNLDQLPQQPGI
jgi:3-deoxy-manno-octulosonate cytidylyltransferase (CMP-KDO synthetase)